VERKVALPMGQREIPATIRVEHRGDTGDGLVRLSSTQIVEGDEALRALMGFLEDVSGDELATDSGVRTFRQTMRLEAETDPDTLRPRRTRYETTTEIVSAGKRRSQRETREDGFDWTKAEGCR
jgi:hypothetical protein